MPWRLLAALLVLLLGQRARTRRASRCSVQRAASRQGNPPLSCATPARPCSAAAWTPPSRSTPRRSRTRRCPMTGAPPFSTDRGVAYCSPAELQGGDRRTSIGRSSSIRVPGGLQQPRQRAAGARRRARGDQGLRPRAAVGTGLCGRLSAIGPARYMKLGQTELAIAGYTKAIQL